MDMLRPMGGCLSTTYPRREIPLQGGRLKDVGYCVKTISRPFTVFKEAFELNHLHVQEVYADVNRNINT